MLIGVPTEIKDHEYRVGLTPESVEALCGAGHQVLIEREAGQAAGFDDRDYRRAGAEIATSARAVFDRSDLVVKVKEPQPEECHMLGAGQGLFAFLHLAADPLQADLLMESGASCFAFETLEDGDGHLPLLAPMSEIAGRLAPQAGAVHLQKDYGGRGVLLSGAGGVLPAHVTVIGGGSVGANAATIAAGLGARVTLLDIDRERVRELQSRFGDRIQCRLSEPAVMEEVVPESEMMVGAVLVPGARAPRVLDRNQLRRMKRGAVLVDVAIDQGGCFETSHMTTYTEPSYELDGVIHYCVGNMPAAVPRTSSLALNHALLPCLMELAELGVERAAREGPPTLISALNVHHGKVVNRAVADSLAVLRGSA